MIEYVSRKEASARYGWSMSKIERLIDGGLIEAHKDIGRVLISVPSCERYFANLPRKEPKSKPPSLEELGLLSDSPKDAKVCSA